jgi:hypothetical protein
MLSELALNKLLAQARGLGLKQSVVLLLSSFFAQISNIPNQLQLESVQFNTISGPMHSNDVS